MRALPLVIALALAALLATPTLRALRANGQVCPNYRGRELPCPFGVLIVVAAVLALIPVALIERLGHVAVVYPQFAAVVVYTLGVALLGLIDDTLGSRAIELRSDANPGGHASGSSGARAVSRGWRGHGRAVLRGEFSTGALKAAGSLGLALLAMSLIDLPTGRWLLASAVLVLATGALNLLDLRPGRAVKAFAALGAALTIGAGELRTLWTLGLFAAPALVAGWYDLRERAMLGDTGSNLLGALAGLWIVFALSQTGQLVALGLLLALTVYGELRSISGLVERVPLLRKLDSVGRPEQPLK
jgi:UDP-GlcNAc:undecaprenyl-phosphate/decaprenyl-phosphate GlcNAc-1-phosphate transferase